MLGPLLTTLLALPGNKQSRWRCRPTRGWSWHIVISGHHGEFRLGNYPASSCSEISLSDIRKVSKVLPLNPAILTGCSSPCFVWDLRKRYALHVGHLFVPSTRLGHLPTFKRRGYTFCWRRGLDTPRPAKMLQAGATAAHLGVGQRVGGDGVIVHSLTVQTSDAPPVCAWALER